MLQWNRDLEGDFKDSCRRIVAKNLCSESELWANYKRMQREILAKYCQSAAALAKFNYYEFYTEKLRSTTWCAANKPMALYIELMLADTPSNVMAEGQGHVGETLLPAHQACKGMLRLDAQCEVKHNAPPLGHCSEVVKASERFWLKSGHFEAANFDASKDEAVCQAHAARFMESGSESWRGDDVELEETKSEHKRKVLKRRHRNKQMKRMCNGLAEHLASLTLAPSED